MNSFQFGQFVGQNQNITRATRIVSGIYNSSGLYSAASTAAGVASVYSGASSLASTLPQAAPFIYGAVGIYAAGQALRSAFG